MRSLIKSHRRSDSSTSDISLYTDSFQKPSNGKSTPMSSPLALQQPTNLPSPQPISYYHNSTKSSPKKLLTPIKRMFGHHSKSNTNIASANDSLNSAVYGDFVPPKGRKNYARSPRSFLNLSDLKSESAFDAKDSVSISANCKHTTDPATPSCAATQNRSKSSLDLNTTLHAPSLRFTKTQHIFPGSSSGPNLATSLSNFSIVNSEDNFTARLLLSQVTPAETCTRSSIENFSDNNSSNSDSSSQFSFVKDKRGGRNTSVKYYKTKILKDMNRSFAKNNDLADNDMAFEDGVLSDYDFDNNGIESDEDLEDSNDFDVKGKYNDFLHEDQSDIGLGLTGAEISPDRTFGQPFSQEPYSSSPIDSVELNLPQSASSPTESTYQSELLDAYLGYTSSKLPLSDIPRQSLNVSLSDSIKGGSVSPVVGAIAPDNPKHASCPEISPKYTTSVEQNENEKSRLSNHNRGPGDLEPEKSNRDSICNMMALLSVLENKSDEHHQETKDELSETLQSIQEVLNNIQDKPSSEVKGNAMRNLIINMMDTLANLEENMEASKGLEDACSSHQTEASSNPRNSVIDMMNTLAQLETAFHERPNLKIDTQSKDHSLHKKVNTKQGYKRKEVQAPSATRKIHEHRRVMSQSEEMEDLADSSICALEEDLLDEINLLPEDYDDADFDGGESLPQFYRSNSYNKRPQKLLVDNSFQKNKIETPSKTVTFYNKSHPPQKESSNSRSASRTGSFKSLKSGDFIAEEDSPAEDVSTVELKEPYGATSSVNTKSCDSLAFRSFNLEPITESHSPYI